MRVYGRPFMLRGEAYLSIDLMASLFLLATVNVLVLGGVEHNVWEVVQIFWLMFALVQTVVMTSLSVAELNTQVTEHREILRSAKVEILGSGKDVDDKALMFLDAIDDLIETREQDADPHKIFGFAAR